MLDKPASTVGSFFAQSSLYYQWWDFYGIHRVLKIDTVYLCGPWLTSETTTVKPIPSHMNPVHILTPFWEPCHGSNSYCCPSAETQVQTQGNPCGGQRGTRMDFSPNTAVFSLLSFHQWYILMSLTFTNLPTCPDLGLYIFSKVVSLD
jgi:hypothetical protein